MGKYTVVEAKRRGQPDSVRVMEVIEVVTITGAGSNDDPVRCLTQYWSTDGMLLAEKDTYTTHSVTE